MAWNDLGERQTRGGRARKRRHSRPACAGTMGPDTPRGEGQYRHAGAGLRGAPRPRSAGSGPALAPPAARAGPWRRGGRTAAVAARGAPRVPSVAWRPGPAPSPRVTTPPDTDPVSALAPPPPRRARPPPSEIGAPSREAAVWGWRRPGRGSATVRLRREPEARSPPGAPWTLGPLRRSARRSTLSPRPHSVGPRTRGEALTLPGVLRGPHRARGPNELACLAPSMHGVRQRPRVGSVAAGSAGSGPGERGTLCASAGVSCAWLSTD